MTKSMTGYAQEVSTKKGGTAWTVEIHSVNRRMLDLHLQLPKDLLFMDIELRKLLSSKLHRGQVNLKIFQKKQEKSGATLLELKKQKAKWEKMARELSAAKEEITLTFLLQQTDTIESDKEITAATKAELKKTVDKALDQLVKMRETEGKALSQDIQKRLKTLSQYVNAIEKLAKKVPAKIRKDLIKRLEEYWEKAAEDDRVVKEIALLGEKADITEEITRLRSHILQMEGLLCGKEPSIGRTLDFFLQEILREVNTISSKSGDLSITQKAVAAKAELEKIREQVQNIE